MPLPLIRPCHAADADAAMLLLGAHAATLIYVTPLEDADPSHHATIFAFAAMPAPGGV